MYKHVIGMLIYVLYGPINYGHNVHISFIHMFKYIHTCMLKYVRVAFSSIFCVSPTARPTCIHNFRQFKHYNTDNVLKCTNQQVEK